MFHVNITFKFIFSVIQKTALKKSNCLTCRWLKTVEMNIREFVFKKCFIKLIIYMEKDFGKRERARKTEEKKNFFLKSTWETHLHEISASQKNKTKIYDNVNMDNIPTTFHSWKKSPCITSFKADCFEQLYIACSNKKLVLDV